MAHGKPGQLTLVADMHRLAASLFAAAVMLVGPGQAAGRSRRLPGTPVPRGFVGTNVDGPVLTSQGGIALPDQFALMRSSGVQSIRVLFSWALAQPYASSADIPAGQRGAFATGTGGIPTSFAGTDQIVAAAAAGGMPILAVVMDAPPWDGAAQSGYGGRLPRDDRLYGRFLTTLIRRYGPRGSFWAQHPELPRRPIRMWEVWNEPDIDDFWPTQPWTSTYLALLRTAHSAIRRADPGARVVLAGLTNYSWRDLASIYRRPGARRLFDVVDVHPYTKYPAGVVRILRHVRATMDKAGDRRKPMIAAETGWLSSLHQTTRAFQFETTEAGQARKLRALLPLLAANRRALGLIGFDWYTWMDYEYPGAPPFSFSGLLAFRDGQVREKPAFGAFVQTVHTIER